MSLNLREISAMPEELLAGLTPCRTRQHGKRGRVQEI